MSSTASQAASRAQKNATLSTDAVEALAHKYGNMCVGVEQSGGKTAANAEAWLERLETIPLQGPWPASSSITAGTLWRERTSVIFVVRRLGCPLCRELVAGLLEYAEEFDDADADIVLISAQDTGAEEIATGRFVNGGDAGVAKPSMRGGSDAAHSTLAQQLMLKIYLDTDSSFHKALGGRRVHNVVALRPDVLVRTAINTVRFGARMDDINEQSDYLGGTLVVHPRLGVLHCQQETEDFRNMTAGDLLGTVQALLETSENAYASMAAAF